MKKTIVLNVTAEDIAGAGRGSKLCPIAMALNRQEGGNPWMVGTTTAFQHDSDTSYYFHNGGAFVIAFDEGRPVYPCQLDLRVG